MTTPAVHFIAFRGEEYWSAVKVWGRPNFIHRGWDTRALREAYRLLYRSNLNVKQACEKIASVHSGPEVISRLLEFIESSQRGIIR